MQVGEIISFGAYKWRVLEIRDTFALFITEHIIEQRQSSDFKKYLTRAFFPSILFLNVYGNDKASKS